MKGISIFKNQNTIRLHPNIYTDNGFARAIPPFVSVEYSELEPGAFKIMILNLIDKSQSGAPFRMISKEEVEAYLKAFGVKSQAQMGAGVNIHVKEGIFEVIPANKRGLFGKPIETDEASFFEVVLELLGLKENQPV